VRRRRRWRAGVERRAAPARRRDDAVGERFGKARGAVAAAAVGDDDLGAAGAQRRQRLEPAATMIAASLSTGMTTVSRRMAQGWRH